MAQYRNQNDSSRQDYRRHAGGRDRHDFSGRDRYDTGNEHRYSPDWGDRSFAAGQHEDNSSFEGDRSYSAGGYPEEFGHRRESYSGRERDNQRFGEQSSGGYYGSAGHYGRNQDYGSRDFDQAGGHRDQPYRHDPYRSSYSGSQGSQGEHSSNQRFGGGSYASPYGAQASYGSQGSVGRDSSYARHAGSDSSWQSQQQSHRGKGPKGYERSDERLKELICERLTDDPNIDASDVTIEVNNKVVKLTGNVENRHIKYQIEDVIEHIGGTRDIDNQLRVQASTGQYGQAASQYGTSGAENTYGARTDNKTGTPGSMPGLSPTKRN